jgi:hypothetical protein
VHSLIHIPGIYFIDLFKFILLVTVNLYSNNITVAIISLPMYDDIKIANQQVIEHLKLNYGLQLNGQPSKRAIFEEDGKLSVSLYNRQPIVYTGINKSTEICINFPIAEVTYEGDDLLESFLNFDENLNELYGHFFAKKTLIGGKLFIKSSNLTTSIQMDILKHYLFCAYNLVKYSIITQFNNLFALNILSKLETLNGEVLNTHEELAEWMNNLYRKKLNSQELINNLSQMKIVDIISYDSLISTSQLRHGISNYETYDERQPRVTSYEEKLSLEDWVGNATYDNLISWIIDFRLFHGLVTNQNEIEISKKIAIDFIKIPKVNLSDKSYLKMIRPSTTLKISLISNNIFSIEDLKSFPFIKCHSESYKDFDYILVKFECYEILLDEDNVKPTKILEQVIEKALDSMKPLENLQQIFDEYGHLFSRRIILGQSLRIILPHSSSNNTFENVGDVNGILKLLNDLNVSYLFTQKGENIKKHDLPNWIKDTNDNLEIIEFDEIIPLYNILTVEQQKMINDILNVFIDPEKSRIIMTGTTDLKDLDNDNVIHYKCIDVDTSLENDNYEVFGSIVSENNVKLDNVCVNFGLYDFNGFYAIIKKSEVLDIDLKNYYVSWMIVGKPSQLSVFSPKNRDSQVNYFKESIELQSNQLNYYVNTPTLSEGYTIFVHAYDSPTNYEPNNILELVKWSKNSINFQITNLSQINLSEDDSSMETKNVIKIDLNICILYGDYKNLKINNDDGKKCFLIGHMLTKENYIECLEGEENKC